MKIVVGDITSEVYDPKRNLDALAVIRNFCRARPEGYQFMPKYKAGHWDGYVSLMTSFAAFPTGLVNLVLTELSDQGYTVELEYKTARRKYSPLHDNSLRGITLRDYQLYAARALLQAGRGIAKMATNSGKTEVMAAMLKAIDAPSIVITHRKELMWQTVKRFSDRGLKHVGYIGDSERKPGVITVAMIQTLANYKSFVSEELNLSYNTTVLIDECHHASSAQMLDVVNQIPGSYRFGFSGTPLKHEVLADLTLISVTGPVVYELTNEYLIKQGYSAKPKIKIHVVENKDKKAWKMEYQEAYDTFVIGNAQRNEFLAQFALAQKGAVLILVTRIDHGNALQNLIPGSVFVSGSDTTERRQEILEAMRDGEGIFIASPIFDEGVDVPALDTVVLAAGGDSSVKLLQRIGRGLRKKQGNNELIVLDFIDDTNKYLLAHSDARIKTYEAEGFDMELV